jgi:hypothetical protein
MSHFKRTDKVILELHAKTGHSGQIWTILKLPWQLLEHIPAKPNFIEISPAVPKKELVAAGQIRPLDYAYDICCSRNKLSFTADKTTNMTRTT